MGMLLFLLVIVVLLIIVFFIAGTVLLVLFLAGHRDNTVNPAVATGGGPQEPAAEPAAGLTVSGISRIRFNSVQAGLRTADREQGMLESTERAASEWLCENTDVEVLSITSTMGEMNASTTIWYKRSTTG